MMKTLIAYAHKLTAWAPAIVLLDLAFAIVAYWTGLVPELAVDGVAAATALSAFIVIALGKRTVPYRTKEDLGYPEGWPRAATANLGFRGYPDAGYGLALACIAGLLLSGADAPQNRIVAAAFLLSVAWSFINREWPAKEESS